MAVTSVPAGFSAATCDSSLGQFIQTAPATASPTSRAGAKTTATRDAAGTGKQTRTAAETERIRAALAARREELRLEYQQHMAEIAELQRDRFTDTAATTRARKMIACTAIFLAISGWAWAKPARKSSGPGISASIRARNG